MSIQYRVVVRDPLGGSPRPLSNIISIEAARAVNTVGAGKLVFADQIPASYWQRDTRFELWRVMPSGHRYLLGNTIWFARNFAYSYTDKTWSVGIKDANFILAQPIIAYTSETPYADKTIEEGTEDAADNLMKAYVRENLGSLATDPDRDLSTYIDIEANLALAPWTEKEASFRELMSTLNELASDAQEQGVPLYFEMEPSNNGRFRFVVKRDMLGQDRTKLASLIRFGPAYNNVTDVNLEWDYSEEKTAVYVGGDGEGAGRLIVSMVDNGRARKSPFGRAEIFHDLKDADLDSVLEAEARAVLAKNRPKLRFEAAAIDTIKTQFGRDYFYGDLVQAEVDELSFKCLIDAFSIDYSDGKETRCDVRLRGENPL